MDQNNPPFGMTVEFPLLPQIQHASGPEELSRVLTNDEWHECQSLFETITGRKFDEPERSVKNWNLFHRPWMPSNRLSAS